METLINIYTDDSAYDNDGTLPAKIVTLEELTNRDQPDSDHLISDISFQIATEGTKANWLTDSRGDNFFRNAVFLVLFSDTLPLHPGQNYWRQFPLGTNPD